MSGQPLIHPTDASKFREQYLATLAQQIKNDDKNLQANKIFKKTGQTPSIVLDTRTSAERLADKYRLKMELRSGLKEIMEGTVAEQVVNETSDYELEFLAQHLPEIVSILKPKYRYGIPFVVFRSFLNNYMKSAIQSSEYLAGHQQSTGQQVLMGIRQILNDMVSKDDLLVASTELAKLVGTNTGLTQAVKRDIEDLQKIIPSKEELVSELEIGNELLAREFQKQLNDALQELPTRTQVIFLLQELNKSMKMRDTKFQNEILGKLHELLSVKPEVMEQMMLIRREIEQSRQESGQSMDDLREFVAEKIAESDELHRGLSQEMIGRISEFVARQLRDELARNESMTQSEMKEFISDKLAEQTKDIKGDIESRRAEEQKLYQVSAGLTDRQKEELSAQRRQVSELASKKDKWDYINEMTKNKSITVKTKGEFLKDIIGTSNIQKDSSYENLDKVINVINTRIGILTAVGSVGKSPSKGQPAEEGRGIVHRKGRGARGRGISDLTDFSKGIATTPAKYVPFGRFSINTQKLGDDIVNLRRPTGCNVYGFPVRRVSSELGSVMRTIVGGGQPEYRHLEKLSDEEKVYLSNLVKKAQIEDRLSIPTPNRDDDEKDIHQYEVMKGEILSGNDNVDLVKKFKILIMKLMRNELLPKNQAKDILLDLATLGY